ncbi:DUF397 domain-containing protein [Nocardia terpenica]|uniref:DUF397 domain-containing protein n=1 Tax=Nocardia terpenica TaxID=455432 RepID=A0A164LLA8_9NOCA|nr:DUF397 domain-containing protein [Nocardia terpenica]KZM72530.1 DUF397 domain-containing protein [Nocardia terpenica]MBF6059474.1 DUF397 domain-containing protein [Nocardia terpenica]MBF6102987.1 DUF397 domain-containing protein [Nocardia terpenica]MBF6110824.1 DUF397 domain-containing protein [Nocardia terpenica]MBF6116955.1 DUF397 domain-containing protein [Nocardia terpenica]
MKVGLSGARWFKSSRSGGSQECVEVAFLGAGHVGVRDSKNPTGPALVFTSAEWDSFTNALETDGFNNQ